MIAIALGIGCVVIPRYLDERAHANLLAECSRLSKESLIASTTDGVSTAEADRKLREDKACWDKINGY